MRAPETAPPPAAEDDPQAAARDAAQRFDSRVHAAAARVTGGLSPVALALAWTDWALHLATQPAQAVRLALRAQQGVLDWWGETLGQVPPDRDDPRFRHPAWQAWPWAPMARACHAADDWWQDATELRGMSAHHAEMSSLLRAPVAGHAVAGQLPAWPTPRCMAARCQRRATTWWRA
jgi:polyhydroxyalkanoate synthase subunit PhaC